MRSIARLIIGMLVFSTSLARAEAARARSQAADWRHRRTSRCDHRCGRRRSRPHDAHFRQRQARGRQGAGAHRRHRRASARKGESRSGVRRVVHAERQRRDDRHDVGAGERSARGAGGDHQHAQRRRGARRDHSVGGRAEERAAAVVAAGRGRDLRRRLERHQRLSREARARASPRSTARRAACPKKAPSAAAPGWCATASRVASARRRESCRSRRAAIRSACWCNATTVRGAIFGSPACRWARRFRISPAASPTTIRCRPNSGRAALRRHAERARTTIGIRDRSSSWSRPMRRCCRIS